MSQNVRRHRNKLRLRSVFSLFNYISISVLDFFAHQSLLLRKAMQLTEEFLKTLLSRCLIPREIPRETESSGRAEK